MKYDMNRVREVCAAEAARLLGNTDCGKVVCYCCRENKALAAILTETPTLFQAQLIKLGACIEARIWVGNKTAREAWETCNRLNWMDWLNYNIGGAYVSTGEALTCAAYRAVRPFAELRALSGDK